MPTYEFRCPEGHDFEKFYRSIGAAPAQVECPRCGAMAARLISAGGGLVFKGSGFYITDYGKDGKKKPESAAPKTEGSKPEASVTSTPAPGPEKPAADSPAKAKAVKE